ncbi:hypothetical protein DM02DRAFT_659501 [Periconia macrospinosa]|uniref:C2H2-type domain-containing protein n=1 Tax=Periconia macrospinosa TaxID=97972 RepID=A0A2V1DDP4_9PLEO|nr:hypothetical protein DM02DRAFT_659501 [Periconia macrospinosa]
MDSKIPPANTQRLLLGEAILSATDVRVRRTLLKICGKNREAHLIACSELLTDPAPSASSASGTGQKRKRFEVCMKCKKEYNVEQNNDEACAWHHGQLLFINDDHDIWIDYDDRVYGPMDSKENQEMWPTAFLWGCCDKRADAKGCIISAHMPRPSKKACNRATSPILVE